MKFNTSVNDVRVFQLNQNAVNDKGGYVLYWMTASRRFQWNYALQYAVDVARQLDIGLIVFEPLVSDHRYASDRHHRFIIEGMLDNRKHASSLPLSYYPWVEKHGDAGRGPLEALAKDACVIVTDFFPGRTLRHRIENAGAEVTMMSVAVDSNGLLPLQLVDREYNTAYSFRRFLHRALPAFIDDKPRPLPLQNITLPTVSVADNILRIWPAADLSTLLKEGGLTSLPINHQVRPATQVGGSDAARDQLDHFVKTLLPQYHNRRNIPDLDSTSRLSPYLHCGHISTHEILATIADHENWSSVKLALKPTGKRSGWWGFSEAAEDFLDELVTWRELAFGFAFKRPDFGTYGCLPRWAQTTLENHVHDERPYLYSPDQFRAAATHDPLWNAAQRQLVREGRIHGYLRMLWGKKIIEWSPTPEQALATMRDLNDRFALDGSDPNSDSGICWCFGLFDRAWGQERPIFGKVRYMASKNTARKVAVTDYLQRYSEAQ